jgi:hypothetical protein
MTASVMLWSSSRLNAKSSRTVSLEMNVSKRERQFWNAGSQSSSAEAGATRAGASRQPTRSAVFDMVTPPHPFGAYGRANVTSSACESRAV